MMNIVIIAVAILLGGYLAFSRRLAGSSSWQAMVTPLASIMGSGFLENKGHGIAQDTAFLSRIVLVAAYFISITYYLQLLGAFLLNAFHLESQIVADVITTVLLLTIGGIGMWRGLIELGAVEKYAVG